MADLNRSPAPFLAPEIISNVLHFVYPKPKDWSKASLTRLESANKLHDLAALAGISSGWTIESQKRLFEQIWVEKSINLSNLVLALESNPQLGRFILSLKLESNPQGSPFLISLRTTGLRAANPITIAHLIFQVLSSVPNLTFLEFLFPPFDSFSPADTAALKSPSPLLSNLLHLRLETSRDESWHQQVFDPIFFAAPNVEELRFSGFAEYSGTRWGSSVPARLKQLSIAEYRGNFLILEGKIWPVAQFEGLESLIMSSTPTDGFTEMEQNSWVPFFEVVGASLVELDCDELPVGAYPFLTALKSAKLASLPFDTSSPPKLLLPPTVKFLKISNWDDNEHVIPLSAWSLTNLEHLNMGSFLDPPDLNELPFLKKLTMEYCQAGVLLEAMENLVAGQVRIGSLELTGVHEVDEEAQIYLEIESFEEELLGRLEELGITDLAYKAMEVPPDFE